MLGSTKKHRCEDPHVRGGAGFSLVELLTVLSILASIVLIVIASYALSAQQSRRVACLHDQRTIDRAIMEYQLDHDGANPPDLAATEPYARWTGPQDFATCPSSGAPFAYDPASGEVSCPNHPI